jgi:excisionase family DNA binding protein
MATTEERPELLTPRELAAYVRVSIRTAYQLCSDGAVPAVKVGGVWRIPRAELDARLGRHSPEMRAPGLAGRKGAREDVRGKLTP